MSDPATARARSRPTQETLDEAVQRLLDDRVRQGFPRTCTDPMVMAAFASAIRDARADRQLRAPADVDAALVEDGAAALGGPYDHMVDEQGQQGPPAKQGHLRPRLRQGNGLDAVQ